MEGNWRPAQGDTSMTSGISASDWRSQLPPESRQKIVNKIMETLKRHLPISVPEGLNELRKIAVRFEEKIYTAAVSQEDYLWKISLKMLSMDSKTQQPSPINPAMSISGNQNPAESGSLIMHAQGNNSNQGLSVPNRQSIPQNIQNNISVTMQGSSVLAPTMPAMSALTQSNISSVQNMPGMSQTSVNNPITQGGQNDIYANAQRMLQGRQQLQQQSQSSSLYQNQLLLKQKMQHSSLLQPQATQASLMQMSSNQSNNIQQAQAANMQSSQQQQNHIQQSVPTMLQPNAQSAANQQGSLLQQQAMPVSQQTMGQQRNMSNISNMQQSHPHSQHNNISEPQQQQQRMPIQQNNLLNIQPQQIINQQQLNSQSNMSGLQQHLLGSMPTISNLQPHRTMMMQKNAAQQTNQQSMSMLQTQGQQAQHHSPQQLMSQFQNQPNQMQQQMLMQQHSNSMQREMQQRIQGPNNLLQGPAGIDQKPFIQAQRLSEVSSSTSIESTTGPGGVPDWQEECYQKIRTLTPHALSSSVSDIGSVVSMVDRIAGSAPGNGSRTAVGEDLVAMTKCRLQARNFISHDVGATAKKMKRHTSAMPLNNVASAGSVNDSFKHFHGLESSELESTATSSLIKRFKSQISHCLREEIREINQKLIDTVVDICDEDADSVASSEDGEGAVVKCSYTAVALSSDLKAQLFATAQTFPIAPLRLLVPVNYPKSSPVLLDNIVETSMECEDVDLSTKAKSKFSISIRCLSQPMSLKEMVKTWDACVRKVILEYAQQFGGGSFSSTFGSWEYCVDA